MSIIIEVIETRYLLGSNGSEAVVKCADGSYHGGFELHLCNDVHDSNYSTYFLGEDKEKAIEDYFDVLMD